MNTISPYNWKCLLLLTLLLFSAGCTNSKIVLSTVYNRLDNQIRGEFNKLGKFEGWQKAAFERKLQTYHYWHRREELPRYAALLKEISNTIKTGGAINTEQATNWSARLENFVDAAQSCYPAHFSADLMYTLKPEQIRFIERRFARERYKNKTRYAVKTRDQRMQGRYDEIEKWTGLAGFNFTSDQEAIILASMHKTKSLHDEYYKLTDIWNKQLFTKIRNKDNENYKKNLEQHLGTLFDLVDNTHPDKLQYNRTVWRDFFLEFEASLSTQQRSWLSSYLRTLAKNLNSISKSKTKFKAHNDKSQGCIPETGA